MDPLEEPMAAVSRAVTRGRYAEAVVFLAQFRRALERRLGEEELTGVERAGLLQKAGTFTEWALRAVQAARAQDAERLRETAASRYGRAASPARRTWSLEAY